MKWILTITLFLCSLLQAQSSFNDALYQAQEDNKNIIVLLMKKDCPSCWYMEHIVLQDHEIVEQLNENFIMVALDIENDVIPTELSYTTLPTTYFLTPSAQVIETLEGAQKRGIFLQHLQNILIK